MFCSNCLAFHHFTECPLSKINHVDRVNSTEPLIYNDVSGTSTAGALNFQHARAAQESTGWLKNRGSTTLASKFLLMKHLHRKTGWMITKVITFPSFALVSASVFTQNLTARFRAGFSVPGAHRKPS